MFGNLRSAVSVPVIVVAGLAAACGGDDDGEGPDGGGEVTTNVDGSKQVGSLTDAELTSLCSDLSAYFESPPVQSSFESSTCRLSAAFGALFFAPTPTTDAELRAACQMVYDECTAGDPTLMNESNCGRPTGACTATVNEITACVSTYPALFSELASMVPSCSEVTLADLEAQGGDNVEVSAACQRVAEKCPDFLADPSEI